MKIDAINYSAFTNSTPVQNLKAEETNSSLDDYDETRIAQKQIQEQKVDNPIEQKQGSIEDLINLQKSTEKMVQSFGFANVADAAAATTNNAQADSSNSVSAVSSASSGGISA